MKILVADDEKGVAEVISAWLTHKGHKVDQVHDGLRALELLKRNQYDLAFLDFSMPEVTGLELLEYLQQTKSHTRTVLITGYQLVEDFFAKAVGIDEFMEKPIRIADLDRVVEKFSRR